MAQLNHNFDKFLDTNLVYKKPEEWRDAPQWHKIYTTPKIGLPDRIIFINKIVDLINSGQSSVQERSELIISEDIKETVIAAYVRLVLQWCGLPLKSTDMLSYINSLGRNINYYPDEIHLIDGFDLQQTKKFLSEDVMDMFKDEVTRIMTEKIEQEKRVSSTKNTDHFDGVGQGLGSMVIQNGGKIRSVKRHPRRKSSAIKRRRRRTSRK